ncbi:hypothetical protein JW868_03600 [Candidatus Woesearchaeota archaeon]|nr:hypothetical protein [Candidatus Woesearchaeota archaeon]
MARIRPSYTNRDYSEKEYLSVLESRLKKHVSVKLYKIESVNIKSGPEYLKALTRKYLNNWFPRIKLSSKGKKVFPAGQSLTNEILWTAFQEQNLAKYKECLFFFSVLCEEDIEFLCRKHNIIYKKHAFKEMPFTSIVGEDSSLGFSLNKSLLALAENITEKDQKQ